jgi:hypothetical protein
MNIASHDHRAVETHVPMGMLTGRPCRADGAPVSSANADRFHHLGRWASAIDGPRRPRPAMRLTTSLPAG